MKNDKQIFRLIRVCSFFLITAVILVATGCSRQKPKRLSTDNASRPVLVVPNEEVAKVRKGMSREEVEAAIGQPREKNFTTSYYKGIWVLFDTNEIVFNVKCVKGFPGVTEEGIGIGSTSNELVTAYGHPDELKRFDAGEDWWYASPAINFWVQRGKVTSFIVHF